VSPEGLIDSCPPSIWAGVPFSHIDLSSRFKGIDELHAVSSREVWRYYTTYRHDPKLLGVLVLPLWMLDTIHQGLNAHIGMFDRLVTMKAY
jgi:hypothetical protein